MFPIRSILHPSDFSPSSKAALQMASSLARDHGSRLIVLHVVLTLGPELVTAGDASSKLEPEDYQAKLWAELKSLLVDETGVKVEYILAEGDPRDQILRVAAEHSVGMIVMGTHGRTGLQRLLMGSVAEQVLRNAACPVLIVKANAGDS